MENTYTGTVNQPPAVRLRTDYALWKVLVFGFLTFGIYDIVFFTSAANSLNKACGSRTGAHTMHFCLLTFLVSPLTCGIASFVWYHRFSAKVGRELKRRGISDPSFGAGSFWGWCMLGSLILVGPFLYIYKLCRALNAINADYNVRG